LNEIVGERGKAPADSSGSLRVRGSFVPAVQNAIAVINFLNDHSPHAATLAELSSRLSITKSHCHSILKTLAHAGWVRFDARTKSYELYSGLIASGSSLLSSPILGRIRERLNQLTREIGFSGVLTQPQADDTFVVIENFTANRSMEVSYPIGFHFPKDAPAQSRAYISWQPQHRIQRWLEELHPQKYTPTSLVDRDALASEVAATRRRGYSRSVGEHFDSMMAFGLPIFDRDGEVLYLFCVMGLVQDIESQEAKIASAMQRTVRDIHQAIVALPPDSFLESVRR
jgi:IclR family transcriptional regulator, acetate operon repressor